jgi:hypothetical protein
MADTPLREDAEAALASNPSFTPGPWKIGNRSVYSLCANIDGPGWTMLASVIVRLTGDEFDHAEGIANAHLIAAAPNLYAKVQIAATIFREYERLHTAKGTFSGDAKARRNAEYAEEMEAALAKARGETA